MSAMSGGLKIPEFASGKKLLEMLVVDIVPPWKIAAEWQVEDWCMQV